MPSGRLAEVAEAAGPESATPAPAMIELFKKSRLDVDMHLPLRMFSPRWPWPRLGLYLVK